MGSCIHFPNDGLPNALPGDDFPGRVVGTEPSEEHVVNGAQRRVLHLC